MGTYSAKILWLDQERLRSLLHYEPATGVFTWIDGPRKGLTAGSQAVKSKYIQIGLGGFKYYAHRLAWLYQHGEHPSKGIDHIDGCGLNNSINNLRDVSQESNSKNSSLSKSSSSGVCGVSWDRFRQKFAVKIGVEYKTIHLGRYDTLEEAIDARKSAEFKYGFHSNHGKLSHD